MGLPWVKLFILFVTMVSLLMANLLSQVPWAIYIHTSLSQPPCNGWLCLRKQLRNVSLHASTTFSWEIYLLLLTLRICYLSLTFFFYYKGHHGSKVKLSKLGDFSKVTLLKPPSQEHKTRVTKPKLCGNKKRQGKGIYVLFRQNLIWLKVISVRTHAHILWQNKFQMAWLPQV